MARLLAGDYGPPPTILVGFNHSGQLRDDVVAARGRVAISVDTKPCARGGVHAVLDVCDVIDMAEWEEAYFNPPCQFSSRSDTVCMHNKMGDGRFWWGVAKVARCLCAPSDKVFVEQPWSHAEEAMGVAASQSIDPRDFDDRVKKTLRVWVRGGGAIRPPLGLIPTAHSAPDHELLQWRNGLPDGDDALELRSDCSGACSLMSRRLSPPAWAAPSLLAPGRFTPTLLRQWPNGCTTSGSPSPGITRMLTRGRRSTTHARTRKCVEPVMAGSLRVSGPPGSARVRPPASLLPRPARWPPFLWSASAHC